MNSMERLSFESREMDSSPSSDSGRRRCCCFRCPWRAALHPEQRIVSRREMGSSLVDPNQYDSVLFDAVSVASEEGFTPRDMPLRHPLLRTVQPSPSSTPTPTPLPSLPTSGRGAPVAGHITDKLLAELLETEQRCRSMAPGMEVFVQKEDHKYTIDVVLGSSALLTCLESFIQGISKETLIHAITDTKQRMKWDCGSFDCYDKMPPKERDAPYHEEILYLIMSCPRILGNRDMLQRCWQRRLHDGGWVMIFQSFDDDSIRPVNKESVRARTKLSGYIIRDVRRGEREGLELININRLDFGGSMPASLQNTVRKMLENRPISWAGACERFCRENPVPPGSDLEKKLQAATEGWPSGASTCSGEVSRTEQSSELSHEDVRSGQEEAPAPIFFSASSCAPSPAAAAVAVADAATASSGPGRASRSTSAAPASAFASSSAFAPAAAAAVATPAAAASFGSGRASRSTSEATDSASVSLSALAPAAAAVAAAAAVPSGPGRASKSASEAPASASACSSASAPAAAAAVAPSGLGHGSKGTSKAPTSASDSASSCAPSPAAAAAVGAAAAPSGPGRVSRSTSEAAGGGHITDALLAELEAINRRCRGEEAATDDGRRIGSSVKVECLSQSEKERFWAMSSPEGQDAITCLESRMSGVTRDDVIRAVTDPMQRSAWDTTISGFQRLVEADPEDPWREEVIYFMLPCPRPLANREMLQRCWQRDLPGGGWAMLFQSIEDENIWPMSEERVRASARLAGYLLRPIIGGPPDSLELVIINNISFGGNVPTWLTNRVQKLLKNKPLEWARSLERHCKEKRDRS